MIKGHDNVVNANEQLRKASVYQVSEMAPVRLSYRYDFHTGTTFIPVRLSYRYDFHTGTTFIHNGSYCGPVFVYMIPVQHESYRYEFTPRQLYWNDMISYQYDFHTDTRSYM